MTLNFQGEKIGEKGHKLNINVIYGAKKKEPRGEKCDKCQQTSINPLNGFSNGRTGEHFSVCDNCYKCQECKEKNIETITNEQSNKWKAGTWLCNDCYNNKPGNKKNKTPEHNQYTCERCHSSCWKDKGDQGPAYYRKRITHWYTDFRKTVNYFCIDGDYGNSVKKGNSKCAEEFKKEHFQTCPNCNKTEWPDMDKGWMLDYEIHKAFCSSKCHVEYRQMSWEQASNLTQTQMYPPQLDISSGENQPNFDWEKEGLKREVLFWREYAKELEKKLANQNNLTPEERQQVNYLQRLQQNTLNSAEKSYKDKYGSLSEDSSKSDKDKGSNKGLIIGLSIFGGACLVGVVVYFLTRIKGNSKKRKY